MPSPSYFNEGDLQARPETQGREGALQTAENIRRGVQEIRVHDDGRDVSFTVTIGVTTFEERPVVDDCIRPADAALYEGKRGGKNGVVAG